ncbi:MAG: coproporphyrinogen III oxidase, partial [Planctomycetales bacterium]|nr:coproporphyrinogen III oxidase [Planctomycetales bacterium]
MAEATKTEVGSYFVSNYPPFSTWSADATGELRDVLATPPADVPLGLYLHIPFCRKRCKFCYF